MKTVADILRSKGAGSEVYSVHPRATALEAMNLMAEKAIGAVLVIDDGSVVGILSERDYARKVVQLEKSAYQLDVQSIMTHNVITVTSQHTNEQCMELMTEKRLRHLPVVDAGVLNGLISIGDLVKDIISDQQSTIEQLERYIRGS